MALFLLLRRLELLPSTVAAAVDPLPARPGRFAILFTEPHRRAAMPIRQASQRDACPGKGILGRAGCALPLVPRPIAKPCRVGRPP